MITLSTSCSKNPSSSDAKFVYSPQRGDKIVLAVFDTGFCPRLIKKNLNIVIKKVHDATNSVTFPCTKINRKNRRYHGHLVLQEFINNLSPKIKLEIHPIIIFDNQGKQSLAHWNQGLRYALSREANILLAAAGLPLTSSKLEEEAKALVNLQVVSFLASGRAGIGIPKDSELFPQYLHKKENIFLIGAVHPAFNEGMYIYDKQLLYQEHIDFYFPGGQNNQLTGSSKAVAVGLAKAMSLCPQFFPNSPLPLRACLKLKTKQLQSSGRKVPTL